ncbi:hypothetical protein [Chromobacterium sp. ASV23]|uniref:hypothetical protein n=1 Tax=Chromobacterium sp. ASV23 TaxID=2795110 RepID=UPI0018EB6737|nr:hypothetical protein [Chromobacterium sp. ASV23]
MISLIVWLSDLQPDVLQLHPGESGEMRRPQGHRRQRRRAGGDDSVHGGLHRGHRLWLGHRADHAADPPRSLAVAATAAIITFWNLALAFGMVVIIAAISSYFAIRRVLKIELFDSFRA